MQGKCFPARGQPDRPELGLTVMTQDEVLYKKRRFHGKAFYGANLILDDLCPQDHVPYQAPGVRIVDVCIIYEFFDFPNVVEKTAGYEQIAVEIRVMVADSVDERNNGNGMFQKPANVSMVHRLRRRSELKPVRYFRSGQNRFAQTAK